MCYFEVAGLFCGLCEGLGAESCRGDEGEGGGEDFVLEGSVAWRVGMVGGVIRPNTREYCSSM